MRLGPDRVLLTAALRFQRPLTLDEVEPASARLEAAIAHACPSIRQLQLEPGAPKPAPGGATSSATAA